MCPQPGAVERSTVLRQVVPGSARSGAPARDAAPVMVAGNPFTGPLWENVGLITNVSKSSQHHTGAVVSPTNHPSTPTHFQLIAQNWRGGQVLGERNAISSAVSVRPESVAFRNGNVSNAYPCTKPGRPARDSPRSSGGSQSYRHAGSQGPRLQPASVFRNTRCRGR